MATSSFLVGEIGGNDYNRPLFRGKSVDEVSNYVADVVAIIKASVTVLRPSHSSKIMPRI
jgi:hypothetical protein